MPKWLIFDAFMLLICEKNVANYALLRCKTFILKIWLYKIFDKFHISFLKKDMPLHQSIHHLAQKVNPYLRWRMSNFFRVKYLTATLLSGRNQHFISREHFCALDVPRNNCRDWFFSDIWKCYWTPIMAAAWKWTFHGFF